jgi:hypothetical protein
MIDKTETINIQTYFWKHGLEGVIVLMAIGLSGILQFETNMRSQAYLNVNCNFEMAIKNIKLFNPLAIIVLFEIFPFHHWFPLFIFCLAIILVPIVMSYGDEKGRNELENYLLFLLNVSFCTVVTVLELQKIK